MRDLSVSASPRRAARRVVRRSATARSSPDSPMSRSRACSSVLPSEWAAARSASELLYLARKLYIEIVCGRSGQSLRLQLLVQYLTQLHALPVR